MKSRKTMKQSKTTREEKKAAPSRRGIGSIAIPMTYGAYLNQFPNGNRDDSAKNEDSGYAIISKRDKTNINWLSEKAFNMINKAFSRLPKA